MSRPTVDGSRDGFLAEARAQARSARMKQRRGWLGVGGAIIWFAVGTLSVVPWWLTSAFFIALGLRAIADFEGAAVARKATTLAILFYAPTTRSTPSRIRGTSERNA